PRLVSGLLIAAALLGVYVVVTRRLEHRRPDELAPRRAGRELLLGLAVGAGLFTATIGVLALFGMYHVDGSNSFTAAFAPLGVAILAATFEELLFRGILFRRLEERFGIWPALAVSALVFGALHLVNPGASVISALAIALTAGVLLGLAYAATGRLWLPIGLHLAWNFTESGIFGVRTSGITLDGLLRSHLTGPQVLSGGPFGAEGSLVTVVVCLLASAVLLRYRKGTGKYPRSREQAM